MEYEVMSVTIQCSYVYSHTQTHTHACAYTHMHACKVTCRAHYIFKVGWAFIRNIHILATNRQAMSTPLNMYNKFCSTKLDFV